MKKKEKKIYITKNKKILLEKLKEKEVIEEKKIDSK